FHAHGVGLLGSQPRLGPRVRSRSSLGSHHDRTRRQRATSITTRVGPVREYTENGVPCAATPMNDCVTPSKTPDPLTSTTDPPASASTGSGPSYCSTPLSNG